MADLKGSAASVIAAVSDTTRFLVSDGGADGVATGALLKSYQGDALQNQSLTDQTINAATTAYLTGSSIAVPAAGLRAGTFFRWKLSLSKTAAGTAANTFHIRVGTAGTTADTARLTFALPVGTAAADVGGIEIFATMRTIGASGTMQGQLTLWHNLSATGLSTVASPTINVLSGTFTTLTAGLIVGLSCTTAASTVLTFQQVLVEAKNL